MKVNNTTVNWPAVGLGCIIRLLFWATTVYILVLSIQRGYSLLVLHVIFSTLGCGLLMIDATLVVTGDALLSTRVSRSGRVTIHWILHMLGIAMLIVGFATIEIHKIRGGSNHFTSDHGKVGLVGYVVAFVVAIAAIPTVCTSLLPRNCSLANAKYLHIYCGIIAFIMLWAGQITGLYRGWWHGSELGTTLTVSAYAVGGFLLLAKPFYTTVHFFSHHGRVGLVGYIAGFVVGVAAIPTVCTSLLPRSWSLANAKYFHIYCGIIAFSLLWAGQITGFYRRWWTGSEMGTDLTITAYVVGGFFLLAKPFGATMLRTSESST